MAVEIIDDNPVEEQATAGRVEVLDGPEEEKGTGNVEVVGEPSQPPDPVGTVNLADHSDKELPEGILRNLPKAVDEFTSKDTYVQQQAASTATQFADFVPGLLRGARANASNFMTAALGEKGASIFRKVARLAPGAAIFAEDETLDKWLDSSQKMREEKKQELREAAIEQGGYTGAAVSQLVDTAENALLNLALFKAINVGYGKEAATNAPKIIRSINTVRNAVIRSTIMTATKEQESLGSAVASFGISLAYQSTPALSSWMSSNAGAVLADIGLNASISKLVTEGKLPGTQSVYDAAIDLANRENHPERASLYATLALIEAYGSDVVFGAMTRSFDRTGAPPSLSNAIRNVEARTAASQYVLRPTGFPKAFSQGKATVPETQAWINAQGIGSWKVKALSPGMNVLPDGAVRLPFTLSSTEGVGDGIRAYAVKVKGTGGESSGEMLPASKPRVSEYEQTSRAEAADIEGQKLVQLMNEAGKAGVNQEASQPREALPPAEAGKDIPTQPEGPVRAPESAQRPANEAATETQRVMADVQAKIDAVPPRADGSVDMGARQRMLDEWKAANPEAVRDVEADGETLYHGTSKQFDRFEVGHEGVNTTNIGGDYRVTRKAIFLTDSPQFAEAFGPFVKQASFAPKNTLELTKDAQLDFAESIDAFKERDLWVAARYANRPWMLFDEELGDRFVQWAKSEGYDSVRFPEEVPSGEGFVEGTTLAVFDAQAIRPSPLTLTPEGRLVGMDEQVRSAPAQEPPSIAAVRSNLSEIMSTLPRSTVARNRAKAEDKGKKDMSIRIEESVEKVLSRVADGRASSTKDASESAQDTFNKAVDSAVKDISAPMNDKAFRNRLFKTRIVTPSQLDTIAVRLHPELDGTEAPRRSLTLKELRAEFPQVDRSRLRDGGMVADIIKTAYDAENPTEALRMLNDLNMIKGRPLITDVATVARGGGPLAERPTYTATDAERSDIMASMPRKLKDNPRGMDAIEKIVGQMDRPLSTDPASRKLEIHLMSKLAYNANKYGDRTPAEEQADYKRLVSYASNLESMRYVFADIATRAADPTIFENYREVDLRNRRATVAVEKRLEAAFEKVASVGVLVGEKVRPMSAKRYAQSNPNISNAIKVLISVPEGKDPESPNSIRRAEAEAVLNGIKDPKHKAQMFALKDSLNDLLQTSAANDVRRLQVYRFGDEWRKAGEDGKTWGEKYIDMRDRGGSRTPNMERTFGVMQAKLDQILPKFDNKGKKATVPLEEMIELDRGYTEKVNTVGRDSANVWLIDRLDKVSWGTRKAYMMTERDREDFQLVPQIRDTPGFGKKQAAEAVAATGEINQRTGLSDVKSGDVIALVYKHMHTLATQAETYHQANALRSTIGKLSNEGRLPDSVYRGLDLWITSQWGKYQNPNELTKLAMKGNAAFWTAYPAALTRIAWYSGRNLMYQGMPWGPLSTQFRPGDVAANYAKTLIAMTDKNSSVRKYYDKNMRSDISNATAMFYEQSLMQDPSSASVVGRAGNQVMQTAWRWSAAAIGMSDQANRIVGLTGYMIADKHIDSYIKSRDNTRTVQTASGETTTRIGPTVSKADVFHRLKMETTHLEQQRQWLKMFDEAKDTQKDSPEWERLKGSTTEIKEENMNFIYRIGGKSPFEQDPNLRPTIGLITYQRGTANELVRNGFTPILDAGKMIKSGQSLSSEQFRDLNSGFQVLAKSVVAHAVSSAVAGYLLGEKRDEWNRDKGKTRPTYSLIHSLMWRKDTPGQGLITKLFDDGSRFIYSLATGDAKNNQSAKKYLMNQGLYFVPALPMIKAMFEASGNVEGVSNVEFLMGELEDSMPTYRNRAEKWSHVLFDTANEHDQAWDISDPLEQFWQRLKRSETLSQIPRNTAIALGLAEPEE